MALIFISYALEVCVWVKGKQSMPFHVGVGLRQECVLLSLLFIVYMNWINKCSPADEYATIGNCKVSRLLFADDLVLLSSTESGLLHALNSFADACDAAGMKISTAKTEVLHLSRNPDQCVLQVNGAPLKQVEKFKYLGVAFTSDGRQDEELDQSWKLVGSTGRSGCRSGRDFSTGRSSRLKHRSNSPFLHLKDT